MDFLEGSSSLCFEKCFKLFFKNIFCEFNTFLKFQVNMLRQYYYKRFFKTQTEKQINGKLSKIGHTFIGTFPWFLLSTSSSPEKFFWATVFN